MLANNRQQFFLDLNSCEKKERKTTLQETQANHMKSAFIKFDLSVNQRPCFFY